MVSKSKQSKIDFKKKVTALLEKGKEKGFLSSQSIDELAKCAEFDETEFALFLDLARDLGVIIKEEEERPDKELPPEVLDSFQVYVREVRKYPLLSPTEEVAFAMAARNGSQEARKKMIVSNLRFVIKMAKNYVSSGVPFADLVEEGNLGLILAVDRFDHTKGFRFSTYASWWIRQSISRGIANQSRTVRIPLHVIHLANRYIKAEQKLTQKLARKPTIEETAEEIKEPLKKVEKLGTLIESIKSLDYISSLEALDGLAETQPALVSPSPEELVELHLRNEWISRLLERLPKREETILRIRFGFYDGTTRTLAETGSFFGVSRERVRQLEKRALLKMKRLVEMTERSFQSGTFG